MTPKLIKKIEESIEYSQHTWRKSCNIAHELDLDHQVVFKCLIENPRIFILSRTLDKNGVPYVTTKKKYRQTTPWWSVLINSISLQLPRA